MVMNMSREMKDSRIAWIGKIPNDWKLLQLKRVLFERKEMNKPIKTDFILSLTMDRGVIPYSEKGSGGNKAKSDLSQYKLAYPNDIVLNSMNVIAGSVGLSKYFGCVSPVYYMLYPKNKDDSIEFFNYIFQSKVFQESLKGLGNGILVKQSESSGKLNTIRMRIPMERLNSILLPIPPYEEQKQIVRYLTEKINEIDINILKLKNLIVEYKKYKSVLINESVRNGLNLNVDTKQSEIKWIGEIPNHWDIIKLKYVSDIHLSNVDKKSVNGEKDVLLCNYVDVYYNDVITDSIDFMKATAKQEQIIRFKLKYDDVLITKDSESPTDIAVPAWVSKDFGNVICGYHLALIRPNKKLDGKYLFYLFMSESISEQFYIKANGITRFGLGKEAINNGIIPLPPLSEQKEIVKHLDSKLQKITKIIKDIEIQIEILQNYRQSLIYEAVTGKIDVRNYTENELEVNL